jgi:hypothetical protein
MMDVEKRKRSFMIFMTFWKLALLPSSGLYQKMEAEPASETSYISPVCVSITSF